MVRRYIQGQFVEHHTKERFIIARTEQGTLISEHTLNVKLFIKLNRSLHFHIYNHRRINLLFLKFR
jgi:hypothetical protein